MGRGRRDPENCGLTDVIDGRRSLIRQTATFDPRGLLGRAYWYVLLPVHEWMFSGLLREIARRAMLRRMPSAGCETDWRDRKV